MLHILMKAHGKRDDQPAYYVGHKTWTLVAIFGIRLALQTLEYRLFQNSNEIGDSNLYHFGGVI